MELDSHRSKRPLTPALMLAVVLGEVVPRLLCFLDRRDMPFHMETKLGVHSWQEAALHAGMRQSATLSGVCAVRWSWGPNKNSDAES